MRLRRTIQIHDPRYARLRQQPSSSANLLLQRCCAPARRHYGATPAGPARAASARQQPLSAEALAQRYCEIQGVTLSDEMRDRLLLTVAAATSEHSVASYLEWLETLDDESKAVVQQLVVSYKAGDVLKAPERTMGWRMRQLLVSSAAKLKEQAQQELAQKARQSGWRPKSERERRGAGVPSSGGSPTDATDVDAETQSVHQTAKPRVRGFEELLPEDWREGGKEEGSQSSASVVRTAVVEHSWQAEKVGDLALAEGEIIEVLSDTEPGSGWWTGRGGSPAQEGIFPANYVSIVLDTDSIDSAAAGNESGLARSPIFREGDECTSATVEMPIAVHVMIDRASTSLSQLRAELDRRVIGQPHVKEGIMLALMTREHIYIEGPPGVAKTYTAEITAQVTALSAYIYQFHRDTKLSELVGEAVIVRESVQSEGSDAELVRQRTEPGGIATADICVLDDITRAPGEALNGEILARSSCLDIWLCSASVTSANARIA